MHARRVGRVVPHEVLRLRVRARDERVRLRDDLLLADDAPERLGRVPGASAAFFTRASVCIVWTSGTSQRSAASHPT